VGVALVVEIVEQGRGGVKLDERGAIGASQSQPVGLHLAAGSHTGFHGQCVLAQALALGPFSEQLPGLAAAIGRFVAGVHYDLHSDQYGSVFFRSFRV
jgi:hypothetical protein